MRASRWFALIFALAVVAPLRADDSFTLNDTITSNGDAVTVRNLPAGRGGAAITVSSYCSCTLVIEGQAYAGGDWEAVIGAPTIGSDGVYAVSASGLFGLRVRASAYTSGTTTISIRVSSASSAVVSPSLSVTQTSGSATVLSRTATATTLLSQSTGGTDETLDNAHEAFSFPMPATEIGGICFQIKRTGTITGGTVKLLLYTDAAGPSVDVSDTSTGQPSMISAVALSTSYAEYCTRQPNSGLSASATYWADVVTSSITGGGTIQIERNSTGTNNYATSADGAAWSVGSSKQPVYRIVSNAGIGVYASSENQYAFDGASTWGFAFRGTCILFACAKFDSVHSFGVGGTSTYSVGVRGSSVSSFGGQFASTGGYGAQASGVTGGIQSTCSGAACVVNDLVPLGNPSIAERVLDGANGFATAWQMSNTGVAQAYASTTLAGQGLSYTVGTTGLLSAQGANIGTTNVVASVASGLYEVCAAIAVTRAATSSSTLPSVTIGWNNGVAQTQQLIASNAGNTTTTHGQDCIPVRSAASQAITYATGSFATSGVTSMQYELYVTARAIY